MREILIAVQIVSDEQGRIHKFSYYRLEEGKCYGVCIRDHTGAVAMLSDVTPSKRKINALLRRLIRGMVSPVGMMDVVEDWLIA